MVYRKLSISKLQHTLRYLKKVDHKGLELHYDNDKGVLYNKFKDEPGITAVNKEFGLKDGVLKINKKDFKYFELAEKKLDGYDWKGLSVVKNKYDICIENRLGLVYRVLGGILNIIETILDKIRPEKIIKDSNRKRRRRR